MNRLRFLTTAARLGFDALREGRLSPSPRQWMTHLRHLDGSMRAGASAAAGPSPSGEPQATLAKEMAGAHHVQLAAFLASGARLRIGRDGPLQVSILLVLFHRAELTYRCLSSLSAHVSVPFEVVVVDNGSTDLTPALLDRLDGVRIVRAGRNLGFLRGCNLAAGLARGANLLLLNNDTELLPGSLESALRTLTSSTNVGAVGGRLVLPDGRLQEAGSIIWRDGSCQGYGRFESPWAPPFSFMRDVDFCSAAFLLTPRELFHRLGGFDDAFSPAYYEDADYCVRLWKAGRRVVYDPDALVVHFEFASSPSPDRALAMQAGRRPVFAARHADWLAGQEASAPNRLLWARHRHRSGLRILLFDDDAPRAAAGFGFPRAASLIRALVDLGHFVTLYPTTAARELPPADAELPRAVEVLTGHGPGRIRAFMEERRGYYDCILVSRSHNLEMLRAKLGAPETWSPGARIVYDAEAITAEREFGRSSLRGERTGASRFETMLAAEIALARGVDAVLAVSEREHQHFAAGGIPNVHVVSHSMPPAATPRSFAERHGILFVGSFHELSPNADAVLWFARDVLPLVRTALALDVRFIVVGRRPPRDVMGLAATGVDVCPAVDDLRPFYDRARVFVAPTRFAAGIPFKVGHATAHGVPVVCTSLLAAQLGWVDGRDLLVADSPAAFAAGCVRLYTDASLWAHVRAAGLERIRTEYDPAHFRAAVEGALGSARPSCSGGVRARIEDAGRAGVEPQQTRKLGHE